MTELIAVGDPDETTAALAEKEAERLSRKPIIQADQ
jgi:hypothetical protein